MKNLKKIVLVLPLLFCFCLVFSTMGKHNLNANIGYYAAKKVGYQEGGQVFVSGVTGYMGSYGGAKLGAKIGAAGGIVGAAVGAGVGAL